MADEAQNKETSLTERAAWLTLAKTFAFACGIALPLLLVRRLSQEEFGLYKQVFLVVGTLVGALPLGFGMSAFYFLPRETERRGQVVLNILLFNAAVGLLALAALALRPTLLETLFSSREMVGYAPLVGLVVLVWIVGSFLDTAAVAHQETRLASVMIVVSQLTRTGLLLGAAFFFTSVRALLWAAILQGLVQLAALVVYLRSRFGPFWRRFDATMLKTQILYALPYGSAGLLYTVQSDLHNYFVAHRFGAAAYAVYSIGCFQLPLALILSESINSVMIPRVSLLEKEGARREIVLLTSRAMRKLAFFFFPLYAFLMVMGREFLSFLFTPQYLASWPVFAVNLTLLPFNILGLDAILRAYAEERYFLLKLRLVLFPVSLAALWFGTLRFGLIGAISVVIGLNLFERLILALRLGHRLGVGRGDVRLLGDVGKLALAALAAAGAAYAARASIAGARPFVALAVCGALFSLAYLAAVLALGVASPEERGRLRSRAARLQKFVPRRRAAHPLA